MVLDARNPELEAAIASDPYDLTAYAVYGDWLQRQGDPRGELVTMQLVADDDALPAKRRTAARQAAARHLTEHAEYLLGPLAQLVDGIGGTATPPLAWRGGFIHRVALDGDDHDVAAIADEVLAHSSGRFLAELAVTATDRASVEAVIAALGRTPPGSLCQLEVFARADLGELDELWPALPRIARVSLIARSYEPGAIALPTVERAQLVAMNVTPTFARALGDAVWPRLARLELRFTRRPFTYQPARARLATIEDLRPLLHRTDLPDLTHLKLRGVPFLGDVLRELPATPLARQLVVLDLCFGKLDEPERDLRLLAEHRAQFERLRELWLPQEVLTPEHRALLGDIARSVVSDSRAPVDTYDGDLQDPIPAGERYGAVRE